MSINHSLINQVYFKRYDFPNLIIKAAISSYVSSHISVICSCYVHIHSSLHLWFISWLLFCFVNFFVTFNPLIIAVFVSHAICPWMYRAQWLRGWLIQILLFYFMLSDKDCFDKTWQKCLYLYKSFLSFICIFCNKGIFITYLLVDFMFLFFVYYFHFIQSLCTFIHNLYMFCNIFAFFFFSIEFYYNFFMCNFFFQLGFL